MRFDVLISHGWVIDGSGGPPYRADVAVRDGRIADVGNIADAGAQADKTIDARGLHVVPGFIDAHVHGDLALLADPIHLPALRQGVTTYILGQDGSAFAPGTTETVQFMRRYTAGFNGHFAHLAADWHDVASYLERFHKTTALNVAFLVPNGNLRLDVIGHENRPATHHELEAMRRLLRAGLDAGAVGLSSGLDYIPSRYADTAELAALCAELAAANAVYVTHMRGYGRRAPAGMREVCEIARLSGAPAHVSHYNGPADLLLPLVDQAHARNLDLTFDTYPYLAGSTILAMVALPPWVQEGGIDATLHRLADRAVRHRLRTEWFSHETPYPLDRTTLAMIAHDDWRRYEGWTVADAARDSDLDAGEFVCELLTASNMAVGVVGYRPGERTEADMRAIMRHPAHMAGSDGIFCGGFPHPRGWGAFARYLGRHTRESGDYDWPTAIAHLSSHAARRFRLADRGLLRPGFAADIAVYDPAAVTDRATYAHGRALAEGVCHVLVNGVPVLLDGEPTGATPGVPLRRA